MLLLLPPQMAKRVGFQGCLFACLFESVCLFVLPIMRSRDLVTNKVKRRPRKNRLPFAKHPTQTNLMMVYLTAINVVVSDAVLFVDLNINAFIYSSLLPWPRATLKIAER